MCNQEMRGSFFFPVAAIPRLVTPVLLSHLISLYSDVLSFFPSPLSGVIPRESVVIVVVARKKSVSFFPHSFKKEMDDYYIRSTAFFLDEIFMYLMKA